MLDRDVVAIDDWSKAAISTSVEIGLQIEQDINDATNEHIEYLNTLKEQTLECNEKRDVTAALICAEKVNSINDIKLRTLISIPHFNKYT